VIACACIVKPGPGQRERPPLRKIEPRQTHRLPIGKRQRLAHLVGRGNGLERQKPGFRIDAAGNQVVIRAAQFVQVLARLRRLHEGSLALLPHHEVAPDQEVQGLPHGDPADPIAFHEGKFRRQAGRGRVDSGGDVTLHDPRDLQIERDGTVLVQPVLDVKVQGFLRWLRAFSRPAEGRAAGNG
jgi:hypothetical protein